MNDRMSDMDALVDVAARAIWTARSDYYELGDWDDDEADGIQGEYQHFARATLLAVGLPALLERVEAAEGALVGVWQEGWRVGRSDGKRQMIDHAHPKTPNPYRGTSDGVSHE